jgi:hypothetical protein
VRKLHGIYGTLRANNIGNVRTGSSCGSTDVQDLGTRLDPNVIHASQNSGSD